jgi:uncharacterized protein DUF3237
MRTRGLMTRRNFAELWTAAAGIAIAPNLIDAHLVASAVTTSHPDVGARTRDAQASAPAAGDDKLQSAFLLDLTLDRGPANTVGSPGGNRVIVPVAGGAFDGPKLKGKVGGPSGDWIVVRADGSSVLDLRVVLETDDGQKIYMACRGIAYTPSGGTLFARIVPTFETGAAKYAWLNNVVAVGVYRPIPEKVAYRVFQIL